jgi:hypothetical protein
VTFPVVVVVVVCVCKPRRVVTMDADHEERKVAHCCDQIQR